MKGVTVAASVALFMVACVTYAVLVNHKSLSDPAVVGFWVTAVVCLCVAGVGLEIVETHRRGREEHERQVWAIIELIGEERDARLDLVEMLPKATSKRDRDAS